MGKFCMRTRMEQSHIGELDFDAVKRKGFIRDHWVVFGTGLIIFKYFPFFNYYFGIKVFGTSMWCYTMWAVLNRMISRITRRNEYMAAQKTAQDVMDGEDSIMESMKRFANDAKCKEDLDGFKAETEAKMGEYRKALVMKMKEDLSERASKQLQSIAIFEAGMGAAMQELVVSEAAASFREQFPNSKPMQDKAFAAAVKALSGTALEPNDDPVAAHFDEAFKSLGGVDLTKTKGNPKGTLAERVAAAQQAKDAEFKQTFMVTAQEAAEVKNLASKAGKEFDLAKLPEADVERLDALYASINAKVGYSLPANLGSKPIGETSDSAANSYTAKIDAQLAAAAEKLREARLKAFVQAF